MVITTTTLMGAMEDEEPLAMIEVGETPAVVTGVESRLIDQYRVPVGKPCRALKCLAKALGFGEATE